MVCCTCNFLYLGCQPVSVGAPWQDDIFTGIHTHTIRLHYTIHTYFPPLSQLESDTHARPGALCVLLWCVWLCVFAYVSEKRTLFSHEKTYLYLSHPHRHFTCLDDPNMLNWSVLHYGWLWWNMDDFGFPSVVRWAAAACWVWRVKRLKGNMDLKTELLWPEYVEG